MLSSVGVKAEEKMRLYIFIPKKIGSKRQATKRIRESDFRNAYLVLYSSGEFTREWFNMNLSECAKDGGCNFTAIGGIFSLLGIAEYSGRGRYRLITSASGEPNIENIIENKEIPIWINLSKFGILGDIIGFIVLAIVGIIAGIGGAILAGLMGGFLRAGILGNPEPGFLSSLFSGYWFFGLFGFFPGLIVGIGYGISKSGKLWIPFTILGALVGYLVEFLYGFPTTLLSAFFYYIGPGLSAYVAAMFLSLIKVHLGLVDEDRASVIIYGLDDEE